MNTCTISGVHIPEGVTIVADVFTLHQSEEFWGHDVKEFKPERFGKTLTQYFWSLSLPILRFSPENSQHRHPMVFVPFGAGPRSCIGMRFALLEVKLVLTKILLKYKFKMSDEQVKTFYYTFYVPIYEYYV